MSLTSPIRRYPDLIVHRQLSRLLQEGAGRFPARDFEAIQARMREIAALSSERERRAEQAEPRACSEEDRVHEGQAEPGVPPRT